MPILNSGLILPVLKVGDTYPAYEIPNLADNLFPVGSTVLVQVRDAGGLLWYQGAGSLIAGKVVAAAIADEDAARFKAGEYIAEVQVTTPAGLVTTVVHAGKLKAEGDNCYPQITPPLIVPGESTPVTPGSGMNFDFQTFPFTGPGLYVTANPPDGLRVVMWFDIGLVPGPELPLTVESNGFSLTDVPASSDPGAPQTVSFFHTY